MSGARSFCTERAVISRNTDSGGGRMGAAAVHIAALPITPLWPVSAETANALELASPRESKECYHVPLDGEPLADVQERDLLSCVNPFTRVSHDYIVVAVEEWPDISDGIPCLRIVVELVKGT